MSTRVRGTIQLLQHRTDQKKADVAWTVLKTATKLAAPHTSRGFQSRAVPHQIHVVDFVLVVPGGFSGHPCVNVEITTNEIIRENDDVTVEGHLDKKRNKLVAKMMESHKTGQIIWAA